MEGTTTILTELLKSNTVIFVLTQVGNLNSSRKRLEICYYIQTQAPFSHSNKKNHFNMIFRNLQLSREALSVLSIT